MELQMGIRTRVQRWDAWRDAGNMDPPKSGAQARSLISVELAVSAYMGA